jgi:hypothetical protein
MVTVRGAYERADLLLKTPGYPHPVARLQPVPGAYEAVGGLFQGEGKRPDSHRFEKVPVHLEEFAPDAIGHSVAALAHQPQ